MSAPRIIAGSLRGRRLIVPADGVRPTKDRVKASIFSALDSRGLLLDAVVLDACAGSGALGFEALSRGAASVTFVENDRAALNALRSNLTAFAVQTVATVVAQPIQQATASMRNSYDLVFLDPPYELASSTVEEILEALCAKAPGGTVVVERPVRGGAFAPPSGWSVTWERKFGDTLVVFVQPALTLAGAPSGIS